MSVTLHHQTMFAISDDAGDFETADEGYYCEDIRHLSRLRLELDGQPAVPLTTQRTADDQAIYYLTNPRLDDACEATLTIVRRLRLDDALHEELCVENFGDDEARFTLALVCDADFAEIFEVKRSIQAGTAAPRRGNAKLERRGAQHRVALRKMVAGGECETAVRFSARPRLRGHAAAFRVRLARRSRFTLAIDVTSRRHGRHEDRRALPVRGEAQAASLDSDHAALTRAYAQAARDIDRLRWKGVDGRVALCGGIPWYLALFGRDSLIASYQSLLHDPSLARTTLQALAALQGAKDDRETCEEPGKILHEHRPELERSARLDVPRYPYYGTVDATPLFLMTVGEYFRVTDDRTLVERLWPNVERAVAWVLRRCRSNRRGVVSYRFSSKQESTNRGWKDSPDSVRFADGRIAEGDIALVEVQGYCVSALESAAELAAELGGADVERWRQAADELRATIERRFWMARRQTFAEALQDDAQVDSLTSNPGHLLFARAIGRRRAEEVARTLLSAPMFSGFGIRTMASSEGGYNPTSYHDGSVWPHDNALIALGLRRYGLDDAAARVVGGMLAALEAFPDGRPPELFSGFDRRDGSPPIAYPDANSPQAWATGAVLLLPRILIGLEVDRRSRELHLDPLRIDGLTHLLIERLPLLGGTVRVEVSWHDGVGRARLSPLPRGWRLRAR